MQIFTFYIDFLADFVQFDFVKVFAAILLFGGCFRLVWRLFAPIACKGQIDA